MQTGIFSSHLDMVLFELVAPLEAAIIDMRAEIICAGILSYFGAPLEEQITSPLESIIALIIY